MNNSLFASLFLVLLIGSAVAGSHDVILVGGGGSASILALRLTENPDVKVKMIERGIDRCDAFSEYVGFYGAFTTHLSNQSIVPDILEKSIYDEHIFTRELDTRSKRLISPRMLGGGTLRNGNAFSRLSAAEMEQLGSPLWTFNATTDDWKRLITYGKCLTGPCDTNAHGTTGPLESNTFEPDSNMAVIKQAYMDGFGLPIIDDSNDGTNLGISNMHRNIKVLPS